MLETAQRNGNHLNERAVPLYQPDPTVAEEYLDTLQRKESLGPEQRLMLAVLEDAIACFQKNLSARNNKGKTLFRETEEWIVEKDSGWIFSFESICEGLGLDPQYVRQGLMRWKEKELRRQTKAEASRLYSNYLRH